MWSREQLKDKAKFALKLNYWKIILVTLIVFVIGGASSGVSLKLDSEDIKTIFSSGVGAGIYDSMENDIFYEDDFYSPFGSNSMLDTFGYFAGILGAVVGVVVLIAMLAGFLLAVFIINPIDVGTKRFFFKSLNQKAEIGEVGYAFDKNYKNVVKILFFRDLYLIGWSMLFVIPGIVKSYEYRMISYLLAENPNLTKEEVFALSKQMMSGQKLEAFVLDLSFFGWDILSSMTLGILGIFYVEPYRCLTNAALYEELSLMHGRPAMAAGQYTDPYQQMNNQYENPTGPSYYDEI